MQGILVLDKPAGFTSFDAVAKLRGICATRKIGHSGTLDPMATGVLPVFVGNAAKAVDMQQNHDKTYVATLRLGQRTDTGDVTGTVLETAPVPANLTADAVQAVLPQFLGSGMQVPPMYSAVKINGQPLYKAARAGKTVERTPRPVEIYSLRLLNAAEAAVSGLTSPCPGEPGQYTEFTLEIACGKGTYVRVLLEEIGAALGCPATMSALRRTRAGVYTLEGACTFPQLQAAKDAGTLAQMLQSVETVFAHLPAVQVTEEIAARLRNGAPTYRWKEPDGTYRACLGEAFLGVCTVQDHILRAKKLFEQTP